MVYDVIVVGGGACRRYDCGVVRLNGKRGVW